MKIIKIETIEFNGEQREYDVVDRNLKGAPRYFIAYHEGRPFISDEVPQNYRPPMVFHELTEFEKLVGTDSPCLNSLKAELKIVPEESRERYIKFRRAVFRELIEYLECNTQNREFISEVRKSLNYLISQ